MYIERIKLKKKLILFGSNQQCENGQQKRNAQQCSVADSRIGRTGYSLNAHLFHVGQHGAIQAVVARAASRALTEHTADFARRLGRARAIVAFESSETHTFGRAVDALARALLRAFVRTRRRFALTLASTAHVVDGARVVVVTRGGVGQRR